jgi:DNA repair exonuclease SbcCD ATPase subunit
VAASALAKLQKISGPTCPACDQKVDARHIENEIKKASKAKERAHATADKIADLSSEIEAAVYMARSVAQQRESLRDAQSKLTALGAPRQPAVVAKELAKVRDAASAISGAVTAAKYLEQMDATAEAGATFDENEIKAALESLKVDLASKKEKLRSLVQEAAASQQVISDHTRVSGEIKQTIETIERLSAFKLENDRRKTLIKAIARLKVRKLHDIVEAIQQALPPYLSVMFGNDDIRVEVDDADPESIERYCSLPNPENPSERIRMSLRAMSKGERARLRVAFIWAVRKLMRPEKTINMMKRMAGLTIKGWKPMARSLTNCEKSTNLFLS